MTEKPTPAVDDWDQSLDARDLRCPLPLLRAKQALRSMEPGQRLRVLATDSGSVRDFQSFSRISGNCLDRWQEEAGVYTYILVKS
jgi:tRNA 2-thiouridine synthesizing protein A